MLLSSGMMAFQTFGLLNIIISGHAFKLQRMIFASHAHHQTCKNTGIVL
jgi:hypothetical protein